MSNHTKTVRRRASSKALVLPSMPDQTISLLTLAAGLIFSAYIVLVIVTVTFATMQTSLASSVRSMQGSISELELTYYSSLSKETTNTPASVGLVPPVVVEYALSKPAQGISFAGK